MKKTGLDPKQTRLVTEAFYEVVKEGLTANEPIYIRKFGSFTLKRRAQKVGRNIGQNTAITLTAYMIPYFKPSAKFADQIRAQEVPTSPRKAT